MESDIPTFGELTPYEHQWELVQNVKEFIRQQFKNYNEGIPTKNAIVNASVSSGKSLMMGCIANHSYQYGVRCMILTSVGELADQNGQELRVMDTPFSYYSAYVGVKSTASTNICATVGTVNNGLCRDFDAKNVPHVLLIDEAHTVDIEDMDGEKLSMFAQVITHFKNINPRLVVIGFTGTPWRNNKSIIGSFWPEELKPAIGRDFLRDNGFTVPDKFGDTKPSYDLSDFDSFEGIQTTDSSDSELEEMHKRMDLSTTQKIMREVHLLCKERNGALVTCAGLKHCIEAAESLPKSETWAVVTTKETRSNTKCEGRKEIVDAVKSGKIKYLFQIGVFTTGFNAPIIDCIVLLRRIMSLVLLEQLLGRGRRLPKQWMVDAGVIKKDSLVLDYSGTLDAMYHLFDDPVLDKCQLEKSKRDDDVLNCPKCLEVNSAYARRCIGKDANEERCDHFWISRECEDLKRGSFVVSKGCGAENDVSARDCRMCGNTLIDPNDKLTGCHYTEDDWKPLNKMKMDVSGKNSDAITVTYYIDNYDKDGNQEIAKVNYWSINGGGKRIWESKFLKNHVLGGWPLIKKVSRMSPFDIVSNLDLFAAPKMVTHRINGKGNSIINVRR